jgi:hypothetical protein
MKRRMFHRVAVSKTRFAAPASTVPTGHEARHQPFGNYEGKAVDALTQRRQSHGEQCRQTELGGRGDRFLASTRTRWRQCRK